MVRSRETTPQSASTDESTHIPADFNNLTVPEIKRILTDCKIDIPAGCRKSDLVHLGDRYAVEHGACPTMAETRLGSFSPETWTASMLRRFHLDQGLDYGPDSTKADLCRVFKDNVKSSDDVDMGCGERENTHHHHSANILPTKNSTPTLSKHHCSSKLNSDPETKHNGNEEIRAFQQRIGDVLEHRRETRTSTTESQTRDYRSAALNAIDGQEDISHPMTSSKAAGRKPTSVYRDTSDLSPQKLHALAKAFARVLHCLDRGEEDIAKLIVIEAVLMF